MKKTIYSIFFIFIALVFLFIIYLSIVGVETTRFNNIIINEIKKKDPNVQITLDKIKVKFDIKKIQVLR